MAKGWRNIPGRRSSKDPGGQEWLGGLNRYCGCLAYGRSSVHMPPLPSSPIPILSESEGAGQRLSRTGGTSPVYQLEGPGREAESPGTGPGLWIPAICPVRRWDFGPREHCWSTESGRGSEGGLFRLAVVESIPISVCLQTKSTCATCLLLFCGPTPTRQIQQQIPSPAALAWNQIPSSNLRFVVSIPTLL